MGGGRGERREERKGEEMREGEEKREGEERGGESR